MEENLNCKICGGFLLVTMASSFIVVNINICEPCRKKIEENPDFHENVHKMMPIESSFITGVTGTSAVSYSSNNISIKSIYKKNDGVI